MLIDWFTVSAQILNFLILVWLLKRYLYRPILQAIDTREERISGELADAARQKKQAQDECELFQKKHEAFNEERASLLKKAAEKAQTEVQAFKDNAQQKAKVLRINQQQMLANDLVKIKQALNKQVSQEIFAITRKTLSDLATAHLEESMCELFIKRLYNLDSTQKNTLALALKSTSATNPAILATRFEVPDALQENIKQAVNDFFSADIPIDFKIFEDIICGIEFSVGGQSLTWNIAEYLAELEHRIDKIIAENNRQNNKNTSTLTPVAGEASSNSEGSNLVAPSATAPHLNSQPSNPSATDAPSASKKSFSSLTIPLNPTDSIPDSSK